MKKLLISIAVVMFSLGLIVQASDLIIESKSQTFTEADNKIKFKGDVKVSVDDLKVVGDSADVNMTDKNGKTALMGAAKKGNKTICKALIDAGVKVAKTPSEIAGFIKEDLEK